MSSITTTLEEVPFRHELVEVVATIEFRIVPAEAHSRDEGPGHAAYAELLSLKVESCDGQPETELGSKTTRDIHAAALAVVNSGDLLESLANPYDNHVLHLIHSTAGD